MGEAHGLPDPYALSTPKFATAGRFIDEETYSLLVRHVDGRYGEVFVTVRPEEDAEQPVVFSGGRIIPLKASPESDGTLRPFYSSASPDTSRISRVAPAWPTLKQPAYPPFFVCPDPKADVPTEDGNYTDDLHYVHQIHRPIMPTDGHFPGDAGSSLLRVIGLTKYAASCVSRTAAKGWERFWADDDEEEEEEDDLHGASQAILEYLRKYSRFDVVESSVQVDIFDPDEVDPSSFQMLGNRPGRYIANFDIRLPTLTSPEGGPLRVTHRIVLDKHFDVIATTIRE